MKLHSQFLKLHSHYGQATEISVTLDELALVLDCTHRNVLHIINKMVKQAWITWTPRRGRGHRSIMEFLVPSEEIALQSMMQAISRQDIQHAIEGIKTHARSSALQDTLQGWLLTYFGHHSEIRSDKQIDTLRLPITQQLHSFDPLYMNLLAESFVASHVFDGLVARSGEGDKIIPGLAHAWEVDESRTVWTFFLRKEVLFHHGKVLVAEDVVYSFQRLMLTSQRTLYSFIYKEIQEVSALGHSAVRIQLKQPNELFLPFLCTSRAAIVPRKLEGMSELSFGRRPLGTGPFKVVEMNEDTCVLEVFPYYFQGRAHLDRVEVIYVPWDIEAASAENGAAFHVIQNPSSADPSSWSRIHSASSTRKFVTCNTKKKGPLSDPSLRAMIVSCLQEESICKESEQVAVQPCSLQIATIPQYAGDAEYIVAALARHGYACKIVTVSPEEFKGPIRLESDFIVFSLFRDQDEQLRLFDLYLTLAQHIEPHTRMDIESRLKRIAREPDSQARAAAFKQIEHRLTSEHHLHILYENPTQTAYLPSVRGVTFNSQGWVDLRHVWFPPLL
ncbi:SgrR family transcriptional regulator [Paenibacillus sp. 19GGS1-52]|uniref:ABC transporter substrate-binding protein n=1 Tax=Paenibacillus sp. 19GGS1-52 TaxID=2758563 RepID=UPI001EFA3F95|nr:ABC transporter substrate-binding protein [Paenibacillus sp. 19GGS1-52]ULO05542.1 SgrR family transcriptional regulator [Paenibacillus sp. 19GGS1-52]